jgi:O-antigen/teichoic acid export membrane protein
MASTVVTSLLGIGFWAVAAHLFTVEIVGRDSALIASMTAISMVCQLNLTNSLVRFLPQVREHIGRRVLTAYALAGGMSLLFGGIFVLVAPHVSDGFDFLDDNVGLAVLFAVSVAAWSLFCLEDAVLTGLGVATWVPIENAVFGAAKLAALPLAYLVAEEHGVFAAWVVPLFLIIPAVNWFMATRALPRAAEKQREAQGVVDVFGWRKLYAFLAQDLVGTATMQIAVAVVPLLVLVQLGSVATAYFYIPFSLITAFDLLFTAIGLSLTAEAARAPQRAKELMHTVVHRFLVFQIPIVIVIIIAAPLLLAPFGSDYVENGTSVMRLLAAASCFRAIVVVYSAVARLKGRGLWVALPQIAVAILLVALVRLLSSPMGIEGVALAWLVAFLVVAVAVLPKLRAWVKDPRVPTASGPLHRAGSFPGSSSS